MYAHLFHPVEKRSAKLWTACVEKERDADAPGYPQTAHIPEQGFPTGFLLHNRMFFLWK